MANVEVVIAAREQRPVFENLMQLYTHDFSEQWYDRPTGEVDEQGRFPAYPLDAYWREPDHVPLLLRANSRIIGFALLNRLTHTNRPLDRNMAPRRPRQSSVAIPACGRRQSHAGTSPAWRSGARRSASIRSPSTSRRLT
jgi:hypothetical protein